MQSQKLPEWVWLVAAFLGVYALKQAIAKTNQDLALQNIGTDNYAQLAQEYRVAFNPSGTEFLMSLDFTNYEAIKVLAVKSRGVYSKVQEAYKVLYGVALATDLQNELTSTQLTEYYKILQSVPVLAPPAKAPASTTTTGGVVLAGGAVKTYAPAPKLDPVKRVYAQKNVNIRQYNNPQQIIRVAKVGDEIGRFAGVHRIQNFDGKGSTMDFYVCEVTVYIFAKAYVYVVKSDATMVK